MAFFTALLRFFLKVCRSKENVLIENAVLDKEIEILLRKMGKKRAHSNFADKLFLVVLDRHPRTGFPSRLWGTMEIRPGLVALARPEFRIRSENGL